MAGIQVIAGNFPKGWANFGFGTIVFGKKPKQGFPDNIILSPKEELLSIKIANSEEESRIGKAAGAGILGGLVFGGVGLVIGGLLGAAEKTKKTITFKAVFTGDRHLLAKTDAETFVKLQTIAFDNAHRLFVTNKVQSSNLGTTTKNLSPKDPNSSPPNTVAKITSKDVFEFTVGLLAIILAIWVVVHFFF